MLEIGERIRAVRLALGYKTQQAMATEMVRLAGTHTTANRVSDWETGGTPAGETLSLIALLHPRDPWGCLEYLRGKRASVPRIHVDGAERAEDVVQAICGILKAAQACPPE
jgi:transcriptional regulator with XRE-family HTH domain